MPLIIINRKDEWMNRLRRINVYLDGEITGTIANGETKAFEVSEGWHQLYSKIDWCSSRTRPFTIAEGETKTFELSSFKMAAWLMPVALCLIIINYLLLTTTQVRIGLWFLVPAFLVLVYFLTIGRKDYLLLKELE